MMASSRLHALTQQKHRSGAPSLVCQGLPSWPGPSQATCLAKLVLNICTEFPAPPNPTPPQLALAILAVWSAGGGTFCPSPGALD